MKTHDQYIYKLKTACMGFLLGIASIFTDHPASCQ